MRRLRLVTYWCGVEQVNVTTVGRGVYSASLRIRLSAAIASIPSPVHPTNDNHLTIQTGAFVLRRHWPLVLAEMLFGIAVSASTSAIAAMSTVRSIR